MLATRADEPEALVLKHSQQRHLAPVAERLDLVQEQGAVLRLGDQPDLSPTCASVNAPRSWPKSSLSRSVSGNAPQLTGTNG